MIPIARFVSFGLAAMAAAAGALGVACTSPSADATDGGSPLHDAALSDDGPVLSPNPSDAAAPSDGSAAGEGGETGDGAPSGTLIYMVIDVAQTLGATPNYSVSATFQLKSAGCTALAAVGPCTGVRCVIDPDAGLVLPGGPSAGDITITGAGAATTTLTYGPDGGQYSRSEGKRGFFSGGDTITLAATGATIAPFGPKTLVAPSDVAFSAPVCSGGDCPGIDRTVDMPVTWAGGVSGNVEVAIETASATQSTAITCLFDATSGSGAVPAAALGMLDPANGTSVSGVEIMFPVTSEVFMVGNQAAVTFIVQSSPSVGQVIVTK